MYKLLYIPYQIEYIVANYANFMTLFDLHASVKSVKLRIHGMVTYILIICDYVKVSTYLEVSVIM